MGLPDTLVLVAAKTNRDPETGNNTKSRSVAVPPPSPGNFSYYVPLGVYLRILSPSLLPLPHFTCACAHALSLSNIFFLNISFPYFRNRKLKFRKTEEFIQCLKCTFPIPSPPALCQQLHSSILASVSL